MVTSIHLVQLTRRECFLNYSTHKFRSTFGKSRLIRDGQKVLVAFSGGQASVAMLHLITEGLSRRAQKKLRFQPTLIFINDTTCLKKFDEKIGKEINSIETAMKESGLDYYIYDLNQVYKDNVDTSDTDLEVKLQKTLSNCSSSTTKLQIIDIMRENLLVSVAKKLDIEMLLVGESLTRLAERTLVSIATGRGASVGQSTVGDAFADLTHGKVTIIRPLRSFSSKEIAIYNRLNSIESYFIPTLLSKASIHTSISKLTENFVGQLSKNSATIINTICRTAEKLDVPAPPDSLSCDLCQRVYDVNVDVTRASANTANVISSLLSLPLPPGVDDILAKPEYSNDKDLQRPFCYACRVFLRDMNSNEHLPIMKRSIKSVKQIEDELSEYILKD